MYLEKAFGCLFVDLVQTMLFFFLESVEDGLTNVFITETSLYKSHPRFSTKLQLWESKVGIKMIEINNSRLVIHIHPQHVLL